MEWEVLLVVAILLGLLVVNMVPKANAPIGWVKWSNGQRTEVCVQTECFVVFTSERFTRGQSVRLVGSRGDRPGSFNGILQPV